MEDVLIRWWVNWLVSHHCSSDRLFHWSPVFLKRVVSSPPAAESTSSKGGVWGGRDGAPAGGGGAWRGSRRAAYHRLCHNWECCLPVRQNSDSLSPHLDRLRWRKADEIWWGFYFSARIFPTRARAAEQSRDRVYFQKKRTAAAPL